MSSARRRCATRTGPIVVHAGQSFLVSGNLTTGYHDINGAAAENNGTITLTGSAGSAWSLGAFSGGTVFTNKGTVILDSGAASQRWPEPVAQTFVNAPGGVCSRHPWVTNLPPERVHQQRHPQSAEDCLVNGVTIAGSPSGGAITALVPARLLDTRTDGVTFDGQGKGAGMQPTSSTEVQVTGRSGVPGPRRDRCGSQRDGDQRPGAGVCHRVPMRRGASKRRARQLRCRIDRAKRCHRQDRRRRKGLPVRLQPDQSHRRCRRLLLRRLSVLTARTSPVARYSNEWRHVRQPGSRRWAGRTGLDDGSTSHRSGRRAG